MAAKDKTLTKLKVGEKMAREPNEPAIFLAGTGRNAYLWIGNNAPTDKWCFATLSGAATLRKLAKAILAEVGEGA